MYPAVPPVALFPVRVPLHTPKHKAFVDDELITTCAGMATVALAVASHPLPSNIVTIYVPAPTECAPAPVCPKFQEYEGPADAVEAIMLPKSPKHNASVPVAVTVGVGLIVIGKVIVPTHPLLVTVKVTLYTPSLDQVTAAGF